MHEFVKEYRRQAQLIRDSETQLSRAEDAAWEAASEEALSHEAVMAPPCCSGSDRTA